jgi:hypothetical protein
MLDPKDRVVSVRIRSAPALCRLKGDSRPGARRCGSGVCQRPSFCNLAVDTRGVVGRSADQNEPTGDRPLGSLPSANGTLLIRDIEVQAAACQVVVREPAGHVPPECVQMRRQFHPGWPVLRPVTTEVGSGRGDQSDRDIPATRISGGLKNGWTTSCCPGSVNI